MANNIGTIAAKIVADAAPFIKGMGDVQKSAASSIGAVKAALGSIPFLGSAFAQIPTSGSGFVSWLEDGLREVKEMSIEAKKVGLSFDEFASVSRLAGGNTEGFVTGLIRMRKNLGEVQGETSNAASAFHAMGMSGLELKNLGTMDAFGKIADQLNSLASDTDKAYFAFKIFGRGYADMLEGISKGSEGVDKAIARNKDLMGSISPQDVANARQAMRAIKDIEDAITGVKRQLAVAAAPFITQLANAFLDLTKNGTDFRGIFEETLRVAAGFFVKVLEGLQEVRDAFRDLVGSKDEIGELFTVGSKGSWLREQWSGVPQWFKGTQADWARINQGTPSSNALDALREFSSGGKLPQAPLTGSTNNLISVNQELMHALEGVESQLQKQIATIGMTADETTRWELQQKGATDAILANVRAQQDQARALKLTDEAQTRLQRFGRDLEGLNDLFNRGKIDIQVYGNAALKALGGLEALKETKLPELITAGSQAAFNLINKRETETDPAQRVIDAINNLRATEKQNEKNTYEMAVALRKLRPADLTK